MPALNFNLGSIETVRKVEPTARRVDVSPEEERKIAQEIERRARKSNKRWSEHQAIARADLKNMVLI